MSLRAMSWNVSNKFQKYMKETMGYMGVKPFL